MRASVPPSRRAAVAPAGRRVGERGGCRESEWRAPLEPPPITPPPVTSRRAFLWSQGPLSWLPSPCTVGPWGSGGLPLVHSGDRSAVSQRPRAHQALSSRPCPDGCPKKSYWHGGPRGRIGAWAVPPGSRVLLGAGRPDGESWGPWAGVGRG